jgi:hypothetical protein
MWPPTARDSLSHVLVTAHGVREPLLRGEN